MISIDDFAQRLSGIPDEQFTHQSVLEFLSENQVDPSSLGPYLYFSNDQYTRNMIHKNRLFELIAICWSSGQKSAIHNHRDQRCWMAVPYGKLQVHNFKLIRKDPASGYCELATSDHFIIEPGSPQMVDPEEPIHQVRNLTTFGSRAVSLHIYSLPFDTCEVYDLAANRYEDAPLVNTSEYGRLTSSLAVEKVIL